MFRRAVTLSRSQLTDDDHQSTPESIRMDEPNRSTPAAPRES
jgi:hypothetical protein